MNYPLKAFARTGKKPEAAFFPPLCAGVARTPFGELHITRDTEGIIAATFRAPVPLPGTTLSEDHAGARAAYAYLATGAGDPPTLCLRGTPFQIAVWEAILAVPVGQTRSYSQIAEAIGRPEAARAVGRATGANPLALFVPCHRIEPSNGKIGGYRWGAPLKKQILIKELTEKRLPLNGRTD